MTTFRHRIRRLFSAAAGSPRAAAKGAALAGVGLLLLAGGTALAAENEHGDAEAAPALVTGETPALPPEPQPVMNPARIVAHTAQLPKPAAKASSKPLFPAELPGEPLGSRPGASAAARPSAGPAGQTAAPLTKAKLSASKGGVSAPARRSHLPLAPSAAEIRREIATRNGGPETAGSTSPGTLGPTGPGKDKSSAARLQEQATSTPVQNRRWPTHVDYTAGPTGPAGGNTAGDRKGALIEASGPEHGVIRNRW